LGIDIGSDGAINDMLIGSVADKAGIAPGMKVLTINGKPYSDTRLNDAVTDAVKPGNPIKLEVAKDDVVSNIVINYSGGLKYPHLEAIAGATDYLSQICKPVASRSTKS
jgi:C-terminal processing protease CtpA/Prc